MTHVDDQTHAVLDVLPAHPRVSAADASDAREDAHRRSEDRKLVQLEHELMPLVRAVLTKRSQGGTRATIQAVLVLLRRLGMLTNTTEPDLILRGLEPGELCDWSTDSQRAVGLRWSTSEDTYLPVCEDCAVAA